MSFGFLKNLALFCSNFLAALIVGAGIPNEFLFPMVMFSSWSQLFKNQTRLANTILYINKKLYIKWSRLTAFLFVPILNGPFQYIDNVFV